MWHLSSWGIDFRLVWAALKCCTFLGPSSQEEMKMKYKSP